MMKVFAFILYWESGKFKKNREKAITLITLYHCNLSIDNYTIRVWSIVVLSVLGLPEPPVR